MHMHPIPIPYYTSCVCAHYLVMRIEKIIKAFLPYKFQLKQITNYAALALST